MLTDFVGLFFWACSGRGFVPRVLSWDMLSIQAHAVARSCSPTHLRWVLCLPWEAVWLKEQPLSWDQETSSHSGFVIVTLCSLGRVIYPHWTSSFSPVKWRWLDQPAVLKRLTSHCDASSLLHQSEDHNGRWPGSFNDSTCLSPRLHYAFQIVLTWKIIILACNIFVMLSSLCLRVPASRCSPRDGIPFSLSFLSWDQLPSWLVANYVLLLSWSKIFLIKKNF